MCMAKPISDELQYRINQDARPKLFPHGGCPVVTDKREVAERWSNCAPPGRPADPLLARPVRDHRQPCAGILPASSISNAPRSDGELVLQVACADDG